MTDPTAPLPDPRTADEPNFSDDESDQRAYCSVCISSVWPENWPNHILGKLHRENAARVLRVTEARAEHRALHAYCKWQRGPHEVYQRLCPDPCHRVKR